MTTVGILSDNHSDWPLHIAESLAGVDAIIHAGDIGPYKLVQDMEAIAPTTAVLGNTDGDMPINESAVVMLDGKKFFVQHIVDPHRLQASLRERLKRIEPDVVVFGHTHQPFCETLGGVLFLNPRLGDAAARGLSAKHGSPNHRPRQNHPKIHRVLSWTESWQA